MSWWLGLATFAPTSLIPTHGMIPTLWDWNLGFWGVWRDKRYRALIEALRPQGLQLHGGVGSLMNYAPRICREINEAMPDVDLWLGVGGDGNKNNCDTKWPEAMALANDVGAKALILNFEGSDEYPWREELHGARVRKAIEECQKSSGGVSLGHTTWPRAEDPSYYGFPYVWKSALGGETAPDFTHPQVYGPKLGMSAMRSRLDKCWRSYDEAEKQGRIKHVERALYLGAYHGHTPSGTCHLAQRTHSACFWVIGAPMYDSDERVLRACCALYNAGYHGVETDNDGNILKTDDGVEIDGIVRYQQDSGLEDIDGAVGPKTLAALGIG